ncbi:MAG: hypothetical protein V7636_2814 [Actinomycetota bacterium]
MNALLYGDPSRSLRWRTAVELDGASEADDEVRAWRAQIDDSRDVRALLDRLATTLSPKEAGYLLCQVAYLGYRGPEVNDAVERIFATQQRDGSWPADDARGAEGPRFVTMLTVVPLRGIAASGFASDPRAERAYEWLLSVRHLDGSWPAGPKGDLGGRGRPSQPEMEYRRLTRGEGCRSATTGAVAALGLHPVRRRSEEARIGVDHLLARETRDDAALGWEVSRLVGLERAMGRITFYVAFDLAFVLDLASRCGVSPDDRRVRDLVDHLETRRGRHGMWEHHAHPQLSRWLTFDLECSLRRLADGDWVGNEEAASFTPYKRGRRRY